MKNDADALAAVVATASTMTTTTGWTADAVAALAAMAGKAATALRPTYQSDAKNNSTTTRAANIAVAAAAPILTVTLALAIHRQLQRRRQRNSHMPPGDLGLPFVGEMFSLLAAPVRFWDERARAAAADGAYSTNIVMSDAVVVTAPELASFALRTEAMGKADMIQHPVVTEVFGKRNLLALTGAEHMRMRKLLHKAFTPEATRAYLPSLDKCALDTLHRLEAATRDGTMVNADAAFKRLALDMFFVSAMGRSVDQEFLDRTAKMFSDMTSALTGFTTLPIPGTVYYRALRARKQLNAELDKLVQEFQDNPNANKASVMGMILDTRDENGNGLTRDEMYDSLAVALFAGHDTTAATMSALVMRMTDPANASFVAKLREEVAELFPGGLAAPLDFDKLRGAKWLNAFMNESWRFSPPVNFAPRVPTEDIPLPNTPFVAPKGSLLLTSVWAMSRNKFWGENPDEFNPEEHFVKRGAATTSSMTPYFSIFGGSTRACIGEQLSRLETLIFLARVAQGWAFEAKPLPRTEFPITFETSEMRVVRV